MLKRLLTTSAAVLVVAACGETPVEAPLDHTPVVAAAIIVDGRPGQYDLAEILIYDDYRGAGSYCIATYAERVNGNGTVNNIRSLGSAEIRATEGAKVTKVQCRFADTSALYEANAEVGTTENCQYFPAEGPSLADGTGRVTAAANTAKDGSDGGNVIFTCRFPVAD